MTTYAQINANVVTNIVIADADWIANQPGTWMEYNAAQPAEIGWNWDPDKQIAYPPQPYPSWTLDDDDVWQPPVPYPTDGANYVWDEGSQQWIKFGS